MKSTFLGKESTSPVKVVNCTQTRQSTIFRKRQHGVTQLHRYAVAFTLSEVLFSSGHLYYIIYIIYYIYNINIFLLSPVTAQLHLMQLRNCVTA